MAPSLYPLHLNSLAIEFYEIGKMKEAKAVSDSILASPYFNRFPEVIETVREIYLKSQPASRLLISFNKSAPKSAQNVLVMPISENPVIESPPTQPAKVFSLLEWKDKMGKEPNGENDNNENLDDMSDKDIFFEIMNLTSEDSITREQLEEILDSVRKITSKKP